MRLDVGCGPTVMKDYVGLDIVDYGQDHVHDVRGGLPFEDGSMEDIRASHFIEHLTPEEAIAFLNECWRVLEPGGQLLIVTPHALRSPCAFVLEHRSYYTECTFTSLNRADNWERYGIRPWEIRKIVTNNRNDIHCWLEPAK